MKPKHLLVTLLASFLATLALLSSRSPGPEGREGAAAPVPQGGRALTLPDPGTPPARGAVPNIAIYPPSPPPPRDFREALKRFSQAVAQGPGGDAWGPAIGGISRFGAEAEAEMIARLERGAGGWELKAAAEVLALVGGEDGIEALAVRLFEAEGGERELLAGALDLIHGEDAVNLLASLYSATGDGELLDAVLRTLSRAATPETIAFLYEMHLEPERVAGQRHKILTALELVNSPEAARALADCVVLPGDPEFALAAARALAKSGTSEALIALADAAEQLLREGRGEAARAALEGIASFSGDGGHELLEYFAEASGRSYAVAEAARKALERLGEPADFDAERGEPAPRPPRSVPPKS